MWKRLTGTIIAAYDHAERHEHGELPHAAHAEAVTTQFLPVGRAVSRVLLEEALAALSARFGRSLLRLKRIALVEGLVALQSVQLSPDEGLLLEQLPMRGDAAPRTGLTIIAQHVPAADLAAFLATALDLASLDIPSQDSHREWLQPWSLSGLRSVCRRWRTRCD